MFTSGGVASNTVLKITNAFFKMLVLYLGRVVLMAAETGIGGKSRDMTHPALNRLAFISNLMAAAALIFKLCMAGEAL